mgnify:CR=1 FL=1
MSEREKGPGPTLPESVRVCTEGPDYSEVICSWDKRRVERLAKRVSEWRAVSPVTEYRRADLAPDPERERLVETIRALVTTEDDGPEGAMGARWILGQVRAALEAHDAKGEAGDDAATRPPSPHSP